VQVIQTEQPPAEIAAHYSAEQLAKTRSYSLDKRNFGIAKQLSGVAEAVLTLWWYVMPLMWRFARSAVARMRPEWAHSEIAVSVAFVLLTGLLSTVKDLPWGLYYTFVIEQRHGFNKQTLALYAADTLKSVRVAL